MRCLKLIKRIANWLREYHRAIEQYNREQSLCS